MGCVMARYAVVDQKTGIVKNMIEWDGKAPFNPEEGADVVACEHGNPGDVYKDKKFYVPGIVSLTPVLIEKQMSQDANGGWIDSSKVDPITIPIGDIDPIIDP